MRVTIAEWRVLVLLRLLSPSERLILGVRWGDVSETAWMLSRHPDGDVPKSVVHGLKRAGHIAISVIPVGNRPQPAGAAAYTITAGGLDWVRARVGAAASQETSVGRHVATQKGVPTKLANALIDDGIDSQEKLRAMDARTLLRVPGIGRKSLRLLSDLGLLGFDISAKPF